MRNYPKQHWSALIHCSKDPSVWNCTLRSAYVGHCITKRSSFSTSIWQTRHARSFLDITSNMYLYKKMKYIFYLHWRLKSVFDTLYIKYMIGLKDNIERTLKYLNVYQTIFSPFKM
ncbi:hypothetical protein KP509_23G002300 [Ceratopteris richardii]|uniref:Uncharacterized protein n=1 Tax=Ceratopteris richardii TaxID=49495 RepID=A0A8T2RWD2_CERRI|nr:hypothetical protein KP509_23G002300 [Ceratopteris richardii]